MEFSVAACIKRCKTSVFGFPGRVACLEKILKHACLHLFGTVTSIMILLSFCAISVDVALQATYSSAMNTHRQDG